MSKDEHEQDSEFLAWLRAESTLPADLRAKWHEIGQAAAPQTGGWKMLAIERELDRRGEPLLDA